MKRLFSLLTCCVLFLGGLSSCLTREEYSEADVNALMEAEVQKKLDDFRRVKEERCLEELLKEAGRRADSILINQAFFERDTTLRPPKPLKPEKPEIKAYRDTTPLRPLFDPKKKKPAADTSKSKE